MSMCWVFIPFMEGNENQGIKTHIPIGEKKW
jgi:hypothetical protein